ncbi:MAG: hypothetical protein JWP89_2793 [Schlesneria sp.]|nr:hypothetical protein [Schlesneria sp.]
MMLPVRQMAKRGDHEFSAVFNRSSLLHRCDRQSGLGGVEAMLLYAPFGKAGKLFP